MSKRDGDEFLHGSTARIEAEGVGRAGEGRILALLVEDVALPDDVAFALLWRRRARTSALASR